jgi:siroheme synthase-like protein
VKFYPVFLNLKDRNVLLVGAGETGLQKVQGLFESEARIHVVAPEALPEIVQWAREKRLRWDSRAYSAADLEDKCLVIAATDDPALQKQVASEARAKGLWVNIVDVPPLCDFIAPAVVTQGDIQIAISTGGAAPAIAKLLRKQLEPVIGPEYAQLVRLVREWRPDILKMPKPQRVSLWERVASQTFLNTIRADGLRTAEAQLKEWIYGKSVI